MVSSLAPQASASANSATPARKESLSLDCSIPSYFCPPACQAPNLLLGGGEASGDAGVDEVGRRALAMSRSAELGACVGHGSSSFWELAENASSSFHHDVRHGPGGKGLKGHHEPGESRRGGRGSSKPAEVCTCC